MEDQWILSIDWLRNFYKEHTQKSLVQYVRLHLIIVILVELLYCFQWACVFPDERNKDQKEINESPPFVDNWWYYWILISRLIFGPPTKPKTEEDVQETKTCSGVDDNWDRSNSRVWRKPTNWLGQLDDLNLSIIFIIILKSWLQFYKKQERIVYNESSLRLHVGRYMYGLCCAYHACPSKLPICCLVWQT